MRALPNLGWRREAHREGIRCRCSRLFLLWLCLMTLLCSTKGTQAQVPKEYQVKAVFLFRLAQFVTWPTNRFSDTNSPVVIGVLGTNPFGEALPLAVRGETAQNRPIEIRELRRDEEAQRCHIVFISRSEASRAEQITGSLAGDSVLTVSDMEDFVIRKGGMVRFLTERNKVNLRINADAAKAAGLVLNSRLLRMAEIVKSE